MRTFNMANKQVTEFEKSLANRLKVLRSDNGLTLDDLASKSGISKATLHRIERCDVSPTTSVLGKLCATYNLPLSALMIQVEEKLRPLITKNEQSIWIDKSIGYKRISVSPPDKNLSCEVLDCELAANSFASSDVPPVTNLEHHLYLLRGELEVTLENKKYHIKENDCLRYKLTGSSSFKVFSDCPANFILVIA